ncbi:MAG TPA: hypothetical protein VLS48_04785 [Anaerolineales bacterium]|nr:hypothetical protein [Anaerolineales bacterium]
MAKVTYDGVVEAVRYSTDGQINWVRTFMRRGATFSDYLIFDRQALIQLLKSGKTLMVGRRLPYLASTFEVSEPIRVVEKNGREVIVSGSPTSERDHLEGVPLI